MRGRTLAILTALAAFIGVPLLLAQAPGFPSTMPPLTVYGRTAISAGPGQAIPMGTLFGLLFNSSSAPTAHAVLLGEGSSSLGIATIGTAGRALLDQGAGADPAFTAMSGDATQAGSGALTIANAAVNNDKLNLDVPRTQALLNLALKPQGRLTLTSATPVMTATASAQTTLFYAPYVGGAVPIYNGTQVGVYAFTSSVSDTVGLSLVLGSNWAANAAFDVFATLSSGSPVLCSVAWTNTTTRATALALYGGFLTNGASATCRTSNSATVTATINQATYLGSFFTNGSTGTIDYILGASASGGTAASLGVYNYYNRVQVVTQVVDSGTSYTYTSATIRQARASAGNQVKYIVGVVEDGVLAMYAQGVQDTATATSQETIGIGCDSTTAFTGQTGNIQNNQAANALPATIGATGYCAPAIGVHTISANEASDGTHANTFDKDSLGTLTVRLQI